MKTLRPSQNKTKSEPESVTGVSVSTRMVTKNEYGKSQLIFSLNVAESSSPR